jgi:hypothetical protein
MQALNTLPDIHSAISGISFQMAISQSKPYQPYHSQINSKSDLPHKHMMHIKPPGTSDPDAMDANIIPCSSFTCFPQLPIELRLEIFNHAMPGERRVQLIFGRGMKKRLVPTVTKETSPVPVMFHVCKESRNQALKVYQLMSTFRRDPCIYFSFTLDTLYFGPDQTISNYDELEPGVECKGTGQPEMDFFLEKFGTGTLSSKIKRLALAGLLFDCAYTPTDTLLKFPGGLTLTEVYDLQNYAQKDSFEDNSEWWKSQVKSVRATYELKRKEWSPPVIGKSDFHISQIFASSWSLKAYAVRA